LIFDGSGLTLSEQINVCQSANFAIGAHGGGMVNLMFLLPSESCEARPTFLESISNELAPDVQSGDMGRRYFNMYSSTPWVEYHHMLYGPPSTGNETVVSLDDFGYALKYLFLPSLQASALAQ
jgi:hypothetical protein